jgi:hypothetical protein
LELLMGQLLERWPTLSQAERVDFLERLLDRWPVPEAVRAGIVTMVRAATAAGSGDQTAAHRRKTRG